MTVTYRVVEPQDLPVPITGYGTLRARDLVPVAPEITGRIQSVAPLLEEGRFVAAETELFVFDRRPFLLARDNAQAQVDALEARREQLIASKQADAERVAVLRESKRLAYKEYERLSRLFTEEGVGSEADVELAQRSALRDHEVLLSLEKALALYDVQLKEARASIAAARAQLGMALLDLERVTVQAPVSGRIDRVSLEAGQVVSAGAVAVVIEAAGTLEAAVPLEGQDLLWLPESCNADGTGRAVPVTVSWLQGGVTWPGTLQHVEKYDAATRSAVIVVSLDAQASRAAAVAPRAGMFCKIALEGKVAPGVIRVPRDVVRANGTVPIFMPKFPAPAGVGKLTFKEVSVLTWRGPSALLDSGLTRGDRVIVSPLPFDVEDLVLKGEPE